MDNYDELGRKDVKKLLLLATLAGRIMLKNGAETYRVEDTVERICISRKDIEFVDAFVIPTGIFISVEYKGEVMTSLKRIKVISRDLNKIDLVNEFSRQFVSTNMSIEDGLNELKNIEKSNAYNPIIKSLFGSLASAFFSIMSGGNYLDFISTYLVSFIMLFILSKISRFKLTFFINNFIGALLASLFSYLSVKIGLGQHLDKIIIGSIVCLVPGVAMTTSIRDTISGDYLSGLSRGMEAIFAALSIAFGVGLMLNFYTRGVH